MSNMRTMIREEVQASVSGLMTPQPSQPDKKRMRDSDSSSEGALSDSELENEEFKDPPGRGKKYLFSSADTDELLGAVRHTMQIEEPPASCSIQDEMFGGLRAQTSKVFPVNAHIRGMILEEWEEAEKRLIIPKDFKLRLPFDPAEVKDWEDVPKIDVPLARVSKRTAIPFEDSSNLKEAMDRKADSLLKRAWESSAAVMRANIAATSVARSMHLWVDDLADQLSSKTPRETILKSLPLLKMGTDFLADASAETVRFTARNQSLSNAARRAIWLKNWSGDVHSKNKLCAIPFSGGRVFGPVLDDILEKASDDKKGFPEDKRKKFQPFRRPRYNQKSDYRGKGKQGRWSYPKGGESRTKNKESTFSGSTPSYHRK
ncbi:lamina-associated polypeptide 2, isoforms alpha/zeta-like isoform X2 [Ranitomeya variabilis]|uniref:lamina-associated polypeptide 2, isoforms alpha/zeta-like isoform X2 n=1 Tax=Ranitomeya variabilis TaxID=490064 RepID=UPI0040565337